MADDNKGAVVEGEEDEESGGSDAGSGDEERTPGRPPVQPRASGSGSFMSPAGTPGNTESELTRQGSRRLLLLAESTTPIPKLERPATPPAEMRDVRLTQNQLRFSTRLEMFERDLTTATQEANEKAQIDIKAAAGALQRTAQAVQATKRVLDTSFEDLLRMAAEYGASTTPRA